MTELQAIVIGAGIAGLSAAIGLRRKGCKVIVLEKSSELRNIGGGIQLRPNAGRVLAEYGLTDIMNAKQDFEGDKYFIRRYADASILAEIRPQDDARIYGAPQWIMSRGILQDTLARTAYECGVEFRLGIRIEQIDVDKPSVIINGECLLADFIVGADGIHSQTRGIILDEKDVTRKDAGGAYYVEVPKEILRNNPDTEYLLESVDFSFGPGQLILRGNLKHGDKFSMVLMTNKVLGEAGVWHKTAEIKEVKKEFKTYHESITKGLNYAKDENCWVWRFSDLSVLPRWRSASGKVVIIGDAAHAILPTGGQGAAMAIEDTGALSECIGRAANAADIPKLLEAYEIIRRPRVDWMARFARARQSTMTMPDGPAQLMRDSMMKAMSQPVWDGEPIDSPPPLGGSLQEHYIRSYNVFEDTNKKLDEML